MYVPDSESSTLSMMQLWRQGLYFSFPMDGDYYDDDDDDDDHGNRDHIGKFIIFSPVTEFLLNGHAVDDILCTTDYSENAPHVFAAITRNQTHRHPKENEENFPEDSAVAIKNPRHPVKRRRLPTPPPSHIPDEPLRCHPNNLWHLRFAHASRSTLAKHPGIASTFDTSNCPACLRAKQHQSSHHASESSAKEICDLIHSDLCGPFTPSRGGSQYFITFLDEVSHYLFVYTIPDKSSATVKKTFQDFITMAENQTNKRIKRLRTDGGGEYLGDVTPILQAKGIIHQKTAPYTPQSNGKAERINRTITESVRAMLYHANLPESFWAEASTTAAHVWNRLPSSAINDQIPFELWFQRDLRQDEIQCLRTFGCMVSNFVPEPRRRPFGKNAMHGTQGIFIGYVENSTTIYKIWDLERRCFTTSDSLRFRELEFPPASLMNDEPPISVSQAPYQHPGRTTTFPAPRPPEIFDEIVVQPPAAIRVFSTDAQPNLNNEPTSFQEALQRPDRDKWIAAMIAEIDSIMENRTWTLCDLPPRKNCITVKWVFKIKLDGNNKIERYKCRIVARGFSQIAGLDFEETFAPVVRIESVRCLLAHATPVGTPNSGCRIDRREPNFRMWKTK
jgi:transposase InsO family protein